MARNRPEECLHRQVAQFLWAACPDLLWWSTANQRGTRRRFEMGVLRALGVLAGVPDLCLVLANGQLGCIELKAQRGRLKPAQAVFRERLEAAGGRWATCRSLDEVIIILARWGVRMRLHRTAA